MLKDKDFLASLHPLIMEAFLGPKRRPRKPTAQRPQTAGTTFDRRTSAFRAHKSKTAPTGRRKPRPPLTIDVVQSDPLSIEWYRASSMVNVAGEPTRLSAVGLGPERAANELLRKLWRRSFRFAEVTITRAGRNPALYADFAEIALTGIPTPGSSYRSHILRRTSPYVNMPPPPGSECPIDRFGHRGPPQRPCAHCDKAFELHSPWHKFCSNLCRLHHFRAVKKRDKTPQILIDPR